MLMQGHEKSETAGPIWRNPATPKSKLFTWLAVQHRIWTSDRRLRHGLQTSTSPCFVCLQEEDTAEHILIQCVFAREAWERCRRRLGGQFQAPTQFCTLQGWWMKERQKFRDKEKKCFDALVCLMCHSLWKNRNAWCFRNPQRQRSAEQLVSQVMEELKAGIVARRGRPAAGVGAPTVSRE